MNLTATFAARNHAPFEESAFSVASSVRKSLRPEQNGVPVRLHRASRGSVVGLFLRNLDFNPIERFVNRRCQVDELVGA